MNRRTIALTIAAASALAASAAEFAVDPARSKVDVTVRATGDKFLAQLDKFQARAQADPATGHPCGGSFTWDFNDLKSANAKRDKEMRRWLDYSQFPTATFQFASCAERDGKVILSGTLAMHGVTNALSIPLQLQREGESVRWEGAFDLNYMTYSLPAISKFGLLKVDPRLAVHFTLAGAIKK